ncbi:elongation factor Ts [Candidatus Desulfofervidus auxilii]|uniref:Elongation factor Ts n=1 Tax=Desulfofervidus auxilii TaxID=1621989 RepID=A0A7U4QM90_DESA2|nr:translation elongation factor Ts [Candidatus Desulfofervidus auxilii]AMM41901.1 elongation factor Ts [Candidatus Desulfofervidus auxilii]
MTITTAQIKELRERTGAGIMDCKKALEKAQGNLEKAIDELRKKGLAKAKKRAGRTAKEGLVHAYIHAGGKIGVLVEVNCETDFVARTEAFQNFVKEIAMQIAATNPLVVNKEELSPKIIEREKEIYHQQAIASGKPEKIIDRIVEGKLQKFFEEACLIEQPYIRDPSIKIKDLLNELVAKTGEKIVVRRFVRFQLGEKLPDETQVSESDA